MPVAALQDTTPLRGRMLIAATGILIVFACGTLGYYLLGHGRWPLADCAYMTVISLTTVGYSETLPGLDRVAYARLFTAALLLCGLGIAFYFVSILTTFFVEGEFLDIRRKRKMRRKIDKLANHVIVCGTGRTGLHIAGEMARAHWPFVAVDNNEECLGRCSETLGDVPCLLGDATDDSVLAAAGIERAHGVVAALNDDKNNLYVVLTARGLNPKLRIVSKAVDPRAAHKLRVAGADKIVSVNQIGGLRLASEMIRPEVVDFLDTLMRDRDRNLRFEEITIPEHSTLVNKPIAETDIRKARNLLIVAACSAESRKYAYSPGPEFVLQSGMTLIVLGETDSVNRLRTALRADLESEQSAQSS